MLRPSRDTERQSGLLPNGASWVSLCSRGDPRAHSGWREACPSAPGHWGPPRRPLDGSTSSDQRDVSLRRLRRCHRRHRSLGSATRMRGRSPTTSWVRSGRPGSALPSWTPHRRTSVPPKLGERQTDLLGRRPPRASRERPEPSNQQHGTRQRGFCEQQKRRKSRGNVSKTATGTPAGPVTPWNVQGSRLQPEDVGWPEGHETETLACAAAGDALQIQRRAQAGR